MSKIQFNIMLKKIDVKKTFNIGGFMYDVKTLMLYAVFLVVLESIYKLFTTSIESIRKIQVVSRLKRVKNETTS